MNKIYIYKYINIKSIKTGGIKVALIDCSECGNKISDQAKFCPKCGKPIAMISSELEKLDAKVSNFNKLEQLIEPKLEVITKKIDCLKIIKAKHVILSLAIIMTLVIVYIGGGLLNPEYKEAKQCLKQLVKEKVENEKYNIDMSSIANLLIQTDYYDEEIEQEIKFRNAENRFLSAYNELNSRDQYKIKEKVEKLRDKDIRDYILYIID